MERDNLAHLDTAAGHLAKKAVMASVNLSEKGSEVDAEGAWGGVSSKAVMVTELVPMMIKIQGLSKSECHVSDLGHASSNQIGSG